MRILLVEDDALIGSGIVTYLKHYGYAVDWLKDGSAALRALQMDEFDVVILDLGLPKKDGLEVLREARKSNGKDKKVTTPVLVLTARDTVDDRITGLDSGADDYLTKPFDLEELHARIRALQRRFVNRAEPTIKFGELELNPAAHTITVGGNLVNLPRREFALLQKLLENIGQVVSREVLSQTLYGWEEDVDSNTLEVHIHNLRKKIGLNLIRTVRGVGYIVDKF
ncbi:MAG: response regulator [Gammaproteobacteria bacterium]|jgi:two-component system response regulator QseB|nr:response regulator [Gammaproteobacteria bacterium]